MESRDEKLEALKAERQVVIHSKELSLQEKKDRVVELNAAIISHLAKKMRQENRVEREKLVSGLQQKSSDILAAAIAEQSAKKWWQLLI